MWNQSINSDWLSNNQQSLSNKGSLLIEIVNHKMITLSIMIVSGVYFCQQHCVHFIDTTYSLFASFWKVHEPAILSGCVQKIFHQLKVSSIIHSSWMIIIGTIFYVSWWRWTLTINLPSDQNFKILYCDKEFILMLKIYRIIINFDKLFNNTHKSLRSLFSIIIDYEVSN